VSGRRLPSAASLRNPAGTTLSPAGRGADRGVMEIPVAVLAVALLAGTLLAHRPGWTTGLRRAAAARWRAQVHLWDVYLSADEWRSPVADPAVTLHWVGRRLEGSVLPDRPR
jgi:hypothetical protein